MTVYAKGVQLFQKVNYSIKNAGSSEIIIEGISPFIDPNSIQVKATGDVIILDSKHKIFYPKPELVTKDGIPLKIKRDIQFLKDSIKSINYEIKEIQDEINVFTASRNILSSNGAVRGQGKINDSLELLKTTLDYYTFKMIEINKKLLNLDKKKSVKNLLKSKMNERLKDLKNYQKNTGLSPKKKKPIHRIIVTLMTKQAARGKINVNSEYAYKYNDPSADNGFIYKSGSAFFLQTSYSQKGLGIVLAAKRNDNFSFRSDRTEGLQNLLINYLRISLRLLIINLFFIFFNYSF